MGSGISKLVYNELEDHSQSPKSIMKTFPRDFDPRSPSQGVYRTPIQYESTPARLLDPRSPTVGIERTPIYTMESTAKSCVGLMSAENCDAVGRKTTLPFNTLESNETVFSHESKSIPYPVLPELAIPSSKSFATTELIEADDDTIVTNSKTDSFKHSVRKITSECHKVKPPGLMMQIGMTAPRSPLGTRNMDSTSLRSTVQLNEARKAESLRMRRSSEDLRLRHVSLFDKENV